ncbi:MAG TPA: isoprenylcysteine carboxylmethyltransferase family protein [Planctomycetota bacterium]|nr:isoprenylcysteine carboxylmethyltransferase family protein [Planctomycetota bacterium]
MSDAARRMKPPMWLILFGLAQLALHRWLPGPTLFSPPWINLGLLPGFAGVTLVIWCLFLFWRHHTNPVPFAEASHLVQDGPYRVSRNPIYLGLTLILASAALFLGTTSPWLPVVSFFLVLRQRFVLREEPWLRARFGAEYQDYVRRVRRWI